MGKDTNQKGHMPTEQKPGARDPKSDKMDHKKTSQDQNSKDGSYSPPKDGMSSKVPDDQKRPSIQEKKI